MEPSDPSSNRQFRYSSSCSSSSHHEAGEGSSMETRRRRMMMTMMSSSSSSSDNDVLREHMFDKVVTPSDVGKLNRLVIPKQHAEKYFPLDSSSNEKGLLLNFEDKGGKAWRFRYSYWNSSQSYVMTKGWSRFVKEKKLNAGDIVSFQRGRPGGGVDVPMVGKEDFKYYIDWRRRMPPPPDQYYYHPQNYYYNTTTILDPNHHHQASPPILQFQHGSAAWFGTTPPPSFSSHVLRPQYQYHLPPHLPLPNMHCFPRDHHPHLSQMMMATTTTSTKTTTSYIGDHNLYVHHTIPTSSSSNNNSSSSSSIYNATNHYYHQNQLHHHPSSTAAAAAATSSTNTASLVHHGSVVYVRPIGVVQGGMQMQTRPNSDQNPTTTTSADLSHPVPIPIEPLPIVQDANKAPKRLRLFGVNMDCPAAAADENDDEDLDDDGDDDDHNDLDEDPAADNYDRYDECTILPDDHLTAAAAAAAASMAPDHQMDHLHTRHHHYDLMISSPNLQSRLYDYDGAYPPTTNTTTTTSIVRSAVFDKGKSTMS